MCTRCKAEGVLCNYSTTKVMGRPRKRARLEANALEEQQSDTSVHEFPMSEPFSNHESWVLPTADVTNGCLESTPIPCTGHNSMTENDSTIGPSQPGKTPISFLPAIATDPITSNEADTLEQLPTDGQCVCLSSMYLAVSPRKISTMASVDKSDDIYASLIAYNLHEHLGFQAL